MSAIRLAGVTLAGLMITGVALAEPESAAPAAVHTGTHVVYTPADLKWVDAPPGLPKGARVAVLEGDPAKAGPFTMRAELPPNYKIMPHWHPAIEHVTVLSGELFVGSGETFNPGAAKKLGAGGFFVMPIKHVHHAFTKGQKTIIQLHGTGPWGINYINPTDDPRNAQSK
jgi:hypothetical protein